MSYSELTNRGNAVILVLNSVLNDNRILKTAHSLKTMGFAPIVFGIKVDNNKSLEKRVELVDGINVVLFNPSFLFDFDSNSLSLKAKLISEIFCFMAQNYLQELKINIEVIYSNDSLTLKCANDLNNCYQTAVWIHDIHEYSHGNTAIGKPIQSLHIEEEQVYLNKADELVTVSSMIKTNLESFHGVEKNISLIYNTPILSKISNSTISDIKTKLNLNKTDKLAVYTGGAREARGLHVVVEALPHIPWLKFCIVTNSINDYTKSLTTLAKSIGVEKRLFFLPYVSPDDIPKFISTADYGLNPILKYGNSEVSMPNKLFDFIHAQIPIVTSDIQTMSNIVTANKIGWVFQSGDSISLANVFNKSLDNYESILNSVKLSTNLRSKFTWENNEKILEEIFLRHEK